MKTKAERSRVQSIREKAQRLGYRLTKSRGTIGLDNLGDYQLISERDNSVVLGSRYDASLEQIEGYLKAKV